MDQEAFQSLLKYYLSCIDAEEATHLQLRKNQAGRTYVFPAENKEEVLFSKDLPKLYLPLKNARHIEFVKRKAPDAETLIDLYYGFPVYIDDKDMLSPLFFIEVEASFSEEDQLVLLPKLNTFAVNRMHFVKRYGAAETQRICAELEGEFGSFDARLKAAEKYLPSLGQDTQRWLKSPILFRTNYSGTRGGLRYDLSHLLKSKDVLSQETALQALVRGSNDAGRLDPASKVASPILEVSLLNADQECAVVNGLSQPLSVVTGPPGTGKTQVVTGLLASAIYNNQSVLFASNNNMPVDGVYERLGQSTGKHGNWLMRLGNLSKRQLCQKVITGLLEQVQSSSALEELADADGEELAAIESEIIATRAELEKAQALQEDITKLHDKENTITASMPSEWVDQFEAIEPPGLDQSNLNKLQKINRPGLMLWLRRKLFSVESFVSKHNALLTSLCGEEESLTDYKGWLLTDESWEQAIEKSRQLGDILSLHQSLVSCISTRRGLEEKMVRYPKVSDLMSLKKKKSKVSQELFENWWLSNLSESVKDATEAFNNYFKDIDDYDSGRHRRLGKSLRALKEFFPIWITTCQSASAVMPPNPGMFDLVVIDEAGQCDIPSIIPLLYRAKRAVIIGDPHQFKHITSIKDEVENAIATETGIEAVTDDWSFTRRSAFDRCFAAANRTSFLKQHYRCHPNIIEFSNAHVYGGKLVEQIPLSKFKDSLPISEHGLIWSNTPGEAIRAKTGAWNPTEVAKTTQTFDRWAQKGLFAVPDITYGIVTPFRRQVEEIRKELSKQPWYQSEQDRFTIGTVHSFQGSECDVLVYSPVVAEGMDEHLVRFAASQKDLINVTVTRAKNLLYIVGDLHSCLETPADTPLHELAVYAESIRKQRQRPMNAAEKAMASILEDLKFSFIPQYDLDPYRFDFMLNSSSGDRYDLEVDGDVHLTAEAVQHDDRRDAYIAIKGFKILRFAARDVMHKPDIIRERLARV